MLPTEILLTILGYLDVVSLVQISAVSKHFRKTVDGPKKLFCWHFFCWTHVICVLCEMSLNRYILDAVRICWWLYPWFSPKYPYSVQELEIRIRLPRFLLLVTFSILTSFSWLLIQRVEPWSLPLPDRWSSRHLPSHLGQYPRVAQTKVRHVEKSWENIKNYDLRMVWRVISVSYYWSDASI